MQQPLYAPLLSSALPLLNSVSAQFRLSSTQLGTRTHAGLCLGPYLSTQVYCERREASRDSLIAPSLVVGGGFVDLSCLVQVHRLQRDLFDRVRSKSRTKMRVRRVEESD